MNRALILGLVLASLVVVGASAQAPPLSPVDASPRLTTPTADLPFQIVRVGEHEFAVDPFFPMVAVITSRSTKLGSNDDLTTTITLQPFYRSGDQMVAGDPFTTFESDLTADTDVGQAWTLVPQVAVEDE